MLEFRHSMTFVNFICILISYAQTISDICSLCIGVKEISCTSTPPEENVFLWLT